MSTIPTILDNHFEGNSNITVGNTTDGNDLATIIQAAKVDIDAIETNIDTVEAGIAAIDRKEPVKLATAAALGACTAAGTGVGKTLTQNAAAIENIDGVAVVVGDRILVKNQVAGKDNGLYTVTVVGTGAVQQVLTRATDADSDTEVTAGMSVFVSEGTVNADRIFYLTTNDTITLDTTALTFSQEDPAEHASQHERAGEDEIDGDHLDIDFTPSNYTPSTTPAEAANVDDLAAHLAGIDDEMVSMGQNLGVASSATIIQAGQPVAAETLTVGADVYEADGAGANINFVIAGTAEGTMDNLLAAAVANGTENLFWEKLNATTLQFSAADGPQGSISGLNPSIALTETMTNYTFNCGNVNLNTLGGDVAGQQEYAVSSIAITAALITAGYARFSYPFVVREFIHTVMTSGGVSRLTQNDTFAIDGNDVVVTLNGGGAPDIQATDVVRITAYA